MGTGIPADLRGRRRNTIFLSHCPRLARKCWAAQDVFIGVNASILVSATPSLDPNVPLARDSWPSKSMWSFPDHYENNRADPFYARHDVEAHHWQISASARDKRAVQVRSRARAGHITVTRSSLLSQETRHGPPHQP